MSKAGRTFLFIMAVTVFTALFVVTTASPESAPATQARASHIETGPRVAWPSMSLDGLNAAVEHRNAQMAAWYTGIHLRDVAAYQAAMERHSRQAQTPTASPPRPSAPSVGGSTNGCQYESLIRSAFGPAGDWAIRIAMRESRCTTYREGAYNPTPCGGGNHAVGIFQLCMPMHADLYPCDWHTADAACEVEAAHRLYLGAGTAPWAL